MATSKYDTPVWLGTVTRKKAFMDSVALGNILYISRTFANFQKQLKFEDELMPVEMVFISYIHRHSGCTQDQLGKDIGIDKTTVAHRLTKLEDMGYIQREISADDARKRLCHLTSKGDSIYPSIHEQYVKFKETIFEGLTEEELELLRRMTGQMKRNAKELLGGYD